MDAPEVVDQDIVMETLNLIKQLNVHSESEHQGPIPFEKLRLILTSPIGLRES